MEKAQRKAIELLKHEIIIQNLVFDYRDGVEYLRQFPESEREAICLDALELGFICLQTTQARHGTEFVRQQMGGLLTEFQAAVTRIAQSYEQELVNQIAAENGQVLAPLKAQIDRTAAVLNAQVDGVRTLLSRDIDPRQETSAIGSALRALTNLLDSKRSDSVQGSFTIALAKVTTENGVLAKAVKSVVSEAVKPLALEVDKLRQELRDKQVASKTLEDTIAKGIAYEQIVVAELQAWAKFSGVCIEHVGQEKNAGDIIVQLTPQSFAATDFRIVIEAKNISSERWSRTTIARYLSKAMVRREANAAIFLSREPLGLAQEIGDWAEGSCAEGLWIATTHPFVIFAIRFLVLMHRLSELRQAKPELDASFLEEQLVQIRTAMGRISTIKRHLTELGKNTEAIRAQAEALKIEIGDALRAIEQVVANAE